MVIENLNDLKNELSLKAKNGLDFTLSAAIIWSAISFIWTLQFKSYDKSILVFMVGTLLLPLALMFSKLLKTNWKVKGNPLQPAGLWFNFAQLFYFPILILIMLKNPDYFVLAYAIITGGHLFPYAWLYKTNWYAIFSGVIVIGALLLGLNLPNERLFLIPLFTSVSLLTLSICLYADVSKKLKLIFDK